MNWHHWVIIGWFVCNAVAAVFMVGKTYTISAGEAVLYAFVLYPFLIWTLVSA